MFIVNDWEVSFLQENPITVCVIRNLKNISQRFTGLAICNPHDKFQYRIGRHKALKTALENPVIWHAPADEYNISFTAYQLPDKAIQKAYWEHYKHLE